MKKDPKIYLNEILKSIDLIQDHVSEMDKKDFMNSRLVQDAVVRRFEIMGEAVKRLPHEIRADNEDVPWKRIAGTRDVFIHDYDDIDLDRTWKTIQNKLPKLKARIKEIIKEIE